MKSQYQELVETIANQAQAIADGKIPTEQLWAQVCRIADNAETLKAWTESYRP